MALIEAESKVEIWKRIDEVLGKLYSEKDFLSLYRVSGVPLSLENCYVNLAIRGENKEMSNIESFQFSSLPSRLSSYESNYDYHWAQFIELHEIFKSFNSENIKSNRVLITGRAGIGKSTLCKKIVYEYQKNGMWKDKFKYLLWIPLRKLKSTQNVKNFGDLFLQQYFENEVDADELKKELWKLCKPGSKDTKDNRVLFVLDGLDEVLSDNQLWCSNLLKELVGHPHVILTTRPFGANLMVNYDLQLETIGFTMQNIYNYITIVTKINLNGVDSVKIDIEIDEIVQFIRSNENIKGLVNIPIQLDIICYNWKLIKEELIDNQITLTTLYETLVYKSWCQHYHRKKGFSTSQPLQIAKHLICKEYESINDYVSKLAFLGLEDNVILFDHGFWMHEKLFEDGNLKLEETLEEIKQIRQTLILHNYISSSDENKNIYCFIHLTFQEYFAAKYISDCFVKNPNKILISAKDSRQVTCSNFILQNKYNKRYEIVWWFVSGILSADTAYIEKFFNLLELEPRDLLGPCHQLLIIGCLSQCYFKLKKERIDRFLETFISWVKFESKFFNYAKGFDPIDSFLMKQTNVFAKMYEMLLSKLESTHLDDRLVAVNALCAKPTLPEKLFCQLRYILTNEGSSKHAKLAATFIFFIRNQLYGKRINLSIWEMKMLEKMLSGQCLPYSQCVDLVELILFGMPEEYRNDFKKESKKITSFKVRKVMIEALKFKLDDRFLRGKRIFRPKLMRHLLHENADDYLLTEDDLLEMSFNIGKDYDLYNPIHTETKIFNSFNRFPIFHNIVGHHLSSENDRLLCILKDVNESQDNRRDAACKLAKLPGRVDQLVIKELVELLSDDICRSDVVDMLSLIISENFEEVIKCAVLKTKSMIRVYSDVFIPQSFDRGMCLYFFENQLCFYTPQFFKLDVEKNEIVSAILDARKELEFPNEIDNLSLQLYNSQNKELSVLFNFHSEPKHSYEVTNELVKLKEHKDVIQKIRTGASLDDIKTVITANRSQVEVEKFVGKADENGIKLIHCISMEGRKDIAQHLVQKYSVGLDDPCESTLFNLRPVHFALLSKDIEMFQYCASNPKLNNEIDIPLHNLQLKNLKPFHMCIITGRIDCIDLYYSGKIQGPIPYQIENYDNILHLAVEFGQAIMLQHILNRLEVQQKETLLREKTPSGYSVLSYAVAKSEISCLYVILHFYFSSTTRSGEEPEIALCHAIENEQVIAVRVLLANNVNPEKVINEKPFKNKTPLQIAMTLSDLNEKNETISARKKILNSIKDTGGRKYVPGNHSPKCLPIDNLVFQGGSVKGVAFVGALQALEYHLAKRSLEYPEEVRPVYGMENVKRVAGTSAGSICACLLAVGYSIDDLKTKLTDVDFTDFLDGFDITPIKEGNFMESIKAVLKQHDEKFSWNIFKTFKILTKYKSICNGNSLLKWIEGLVSEKLEKDFDDPNVPKGIKEILNTYNRKYEHLTFGDLRKLHEANKKYLHLHVIAAKLAGEGEIQTTESINSNDKKFDNVLVVDAVRASISIPGIFEPYSIRRIDPLQKDQTPQPLNSSVYIDGGLLKNYPIEEFDRLRYLHSFDGIPDKPMQNMFTLGFSLVTSKQDEIKDHHKDQYHSTAPKSYFIKLREKLSQFFQNLPSDGFKTFVCQLMSYYYGAESLIAAYENTREGRTIEIGDNGVSLFDFSLKEKQKEELRKSGEKSVCKYFEVDYNEYESDCQKKNCGPLPYIVDEAD